MQFSNFICLLYCSVWFCCRNGRIWPGIRSFYESSTVSAKESIIAWSMEMAFNRVCLLLWCFWYIHQTQVLQCGCVEVNLLNHAKPYFRPLDFILSFTLAPCFILFIFLCFTSWSWSKFLMCNVDRYLTYVMDVATPTADCLMLVYDLLMPVLMKGHSKSTLSHQEVHIKISIISCLVLLIWL